MNICVEDCLLPCATPTDVMHDRPHQIAKQELNLRLHTPTPAKAQHFNNTHVVTMLRLRASQAYGLIASLSNPNFG